ncbi:hypothetical protein U1Q18_032777, partial [Sarracenia purpurea var. burkii]
MNNANRFSILHSLGAEDEVKINNVPKPQSRGLRSVAFKVESVKEDTEPDEDDKSDEEVSGDGVTRSEQRMYEPQEDENKSESCEKGASEIDDSEGINGGDEEESKVELECIEGGVGVSKLESLSPVVYEDEEDIISGTNGPSESE